MVNFAVEMLLLARGKFMTAFNDNNITDAGRCDINLNTPKPVPFQHRRHLYRRQTLLHTHQKPGIKKL
jgi:hypothetical protein